jgi:hypothetical protein
LTVGNTGKEIFDVISNIFSELNIDVSKVVSITTDGASNMVGKNVGFVKLFKDSIGHEIIPFHCIIHQEVLCSKSGFNEIMTTITKIINFISARPLHKREFSALLLESDSSNNGLLMFNNIRWLSRGKVLERFVDNFAEIKTYLDLKQSFIAPQIKNHMWVSSLMFFIDLSIFLNELNLKLQGKGISIDVMFGFIKSFEAKIEVFKRVLRDKRFKYFPRTKKI